MAKVKVDSKGAAALKKVGLEKIAVALATEASQFGAAEASSSLEFLEKDEASDGDYMVILTVTVRKV